MKSMYHERHKIEQAVEKAIEDKFGSVDYMTRYDLLKEKKQDSLEEYQKYLNYFHYAFNLGENGKIYLWTRFNANLIGEEFPYDEADFSAEEIAFLKKASAVKQGDGFCNINKPIYTERLKLARLSDEDIKTLRARLKDGGVEDFEIYTDILYSDEAVEHYFYDLPLMFGIYLDEKIIGTIGFTEKRNPELFNLEFYVLQEHRGKGYLQEAMAKLLDLAFSDKLVVNEETLYDNIYVETVQPIYFVRIATRDDNERVAHLAKKFGASYDGKELYASKVSDGYHDMLLFTIVNPNYKK